MAEKEYRRLTWPRVRLKLASLWLGRDHLLCIDSNGYTEDYKRFYFRDIQAITICQTNRRAVINGVFLILLIPFLAMLIAALLSNKDHVGTIIFSSIMCVVLLLPLLMNNFYGTACTCHLRTAVQVEELAALGRVRRARKAIARLRPLIAEAQGQLTAEEIPARMRELTATRPESPSATPAQFAVDDPNQPPRIL